MTESASQLLHSRTQELNPIFCYNRLVKPLLVHASKN